mmetsp:Transcript_22245/g.35768  ORF Transcript_22245/g.35768 Transcript_22245/m.35768 type:complete len:118 (-) Transcript_22245:272-625(-)
MNEIRKTEKINFQAQVCDSYRTAGVHSLHAESPKIDGSQVWKEHGKRPNARSLLLIEDFIISIPRLYAVLQTPSKCATLNEIPGRYYYSAGCYKLDFRHLRADGKDCHIVIFSGVRG